MPLVTFLPSPNDSGIEAFMRTNISPTEDFKLGPSGISALTIGAISFIGKGDVRRGSMMRFDLGAVESLRNPQLERMIPLLDQWVVLIQPSLESLSEDRFNLRCVGLQQTLDQASGFGVVLFFLFLGNESLLSFPDGIANGDAA